MSVPNTPFALFDFDGTIADSNGAVIDLIAGFFRESSLPVDYRFIERAKTMSEEDFCVQFSRLPGVAMSAGELNNRLFQFARHFYSDVVKAKPGAAAYIKKLSRQGVRMCVVTASAEPLIRSSLDHLGLSAYFEDVVTPARVGGKGKSEPDIFLESARVMGVADFSQLTIYDDALDALKTASSLGAWTVGVYDDAGIDQAGEIRRVADCYIQSFCDLL